MASEADESMSGHSDREETVFDGLEEEIDSGDSVGDDGEDSNDKNSESDDSIESIEGEEHAHCNRQIKILRMELKKYKDAYEEISQKEENQRKLVRGLQHQLRDRRQTLHTERVR